MTVHFEFYPLRVVVQVLRAFMLVMSLIGAYSTFHFYWPTSVTVNGHRVNRAQLVDWVIDRELQRK